MVEVEKSKRLLEILSENRTEPIVDKDVDDLIEYLMNSPTDGNFRNITINSLSLCLDIFPNNGVLSEKQKKKVVFHGLLQLGSSLPSAGVDSNKDTTTPTTPTTATQSSASLVTLFQNALDIILSTAMIPSDDHNQTAVRDAITQNNNNKNTTIGIEMLLTPYLSRLQRYNIAIQPYLTRICTNRLNPVNAAALINSILALNQNNPLITDQMVQSFTSNLINCLYDLARYQEYDSIPPLIYQICQLIDRNSGRAQMTLVAIASFLNSLLNDTSFHKRRQIESGNDDDEKKGDDSEEWKRENEIQWTIFTSLNHLGNVLRSNPILPGALLKILQGKRKVKELTTSSDVHSNTAAKKMVDPPFRYLRITPILLAMGLTMSMYIPRMRDSTMNCIRDLVLEEELIRVKRTKSDWFNACTAILLTSSQQLQIDDDGKFSLTSGENSDKEKEYERHVKEQVKKYQQSSRGGRKGSIDSSYMLDCIKNLLFLTSGLSNRANSGEKSQNGNSRGAESNSDLYPALVSLGFLLIDTVKKDTDIPFSNRATAGVHIVEDVPTCTSSLNQNSNSSIQKEAYLSSAVVGRKLLKYLFLHAGMDNEDDDVVIGNGGFVSHVTLSPLCRTILMTMFEKFCGMAPNSIEHSYLLRDIAYSRQGDHQSENTLSFDGDTIHVEKAIGAGILEEFFLPMIIDSLSNVPGGGMPPAVALVSIIPTLNQVLRVALWKAKRNRHKQNELDDHIDHCFLLAKKALFCTDIERRKVAVHLLIMLINIASERSENSGASHSGSTVLDEARGYLRRCMTQHQCDVRLEVYASLVSQMSKADEGDDETESDGCRQHSVISQILLNHLERYITVQEEESVIEARRKRAIQLGTHLSQQMDYSDDDLSSGQDLPPLLLEMCTRSFARHSSNSHQLGVNVGRKKKQTTGPASLVADAIDCILEPISFLLASSIAVVREAKKAMSSDEASEALTQTLRDLRSKVADSKLEQYLQYFERESKHRHSNEHNPRVLSTCILVASIAETLMAIPSPNDDNEVMDIHTVEKLFQLRSDAVVKGSVILATLPIKTKTKKRTSPKKKKQTKKKVPVEVLPNSDDDNSEDEKDTSTNGAQVKPQALQRARRLFEDTVSSMSPSQSPLFLSKTFRECGILSQKRDSNDILHDGETNDLGGDDGIYLRLTKNVIFRRFLLEKTESLLQGRSLVVRAGDRFDCKHLPGCDDSIGLYYIICSLQLGPVLLSEFCSHVQCRDLTSLTDQSDCSLAQVAMNTFIFCVQRMTSYVKGHNMNNQQRLSSLLKSSIDTLCGQFPSVKSRLDILATRNKVTRISSSWSNDENNLIELIIPLLVPLDKHNTANYGGLLFELVANGLDGEAIGCCNLLTCILKELGPTLRQLLGMDLLRCFNDSNPESTIQGLLDLQHDCALSSNNTCGKSSVKVIDTVMLLDGQLDSLTHIPGLKSSPSGRSVLDFTDSTVSYMNQLLQNDINPSQYENRNGSELLGTTHILAQSFIATTGLNYGAGFRENETKLMSKVPFLCTEIVAIKPSPADSEVAKDLISISSTTLPSILDKALIDAEFICTKALPLASGVSLSLIQEMLACRLIAVAKTINVLAPGADSFDNQAIFVAFLLKCAKRLHIAVNKLVSSYLNNPSSILLKETRTLLTLWSGELNKRTASLLLVLQERNRTQDGKVMTDSKIDSHGKIASLVVFEKERTDSSILKLSAAKHKLDRSNDETKFLQEKILVSTHRGFKIADSELQAAKERTATSSKSNGKKRKTSSSGPKSSSSKKRTYHDSDVSDSASHMEDASDDEEEIKEEGSIAESHSMLEDDEDGSRTQESEQHTVSEMEDTEDEDSENEL